MVMVEDVFWIRENIRFSGPHPWRTNESFPLFGCPRSENRFMNFLFWKSFILPIRWQKVWPRLGKMCEQELYREGNDLVPRGFSHLDIYIDFSIEERILILLALSVLKLKFLCRIMLSQFFCSFFPSWLSIWIRFFFRKSPWTDSGTGTMSRVPSSFEPLVWPREAKLIDNSKTIFFFLLNLVRSLVSSCPTRNTSIILGKKLSTGSLPEEEED